MRPWVCSLAGNLLATCSQPTEFPMPDIVKHIAELANLLEEPLQEKLWQYAELLYVEQVCFGSTDPSPWSIEPPPVQR